MNTITKLTAAAFCGLALAACGGSGSSDGGAANNSGDTGGGTTGGQTTYTVTPSMNTGGAAGGNTISPAGAVTVASGASATFTLTPSPGYAVSGVGGTCGGSWSGNTYTTKPVTADCTVAVTFAKVTVTGSIAACFTATQATTFALTSPEPGYYPVKTTFGPGTFNGQAAMVQTSFWDATSGYTDYWSVTSSGVTELAHTTTNLAGQVSAPDIPNPPLILPLNMQPGQFVDYGIDGNTARVTLIGFETLTLAGKTFTNTCHFQRQDMSSPSQFADQSWYAPGYGVIRFTDGPNATIQYAGDL